MAERYTVTVDGGFEIQEAISTGDFDLERGETLYGVGYGSANVDNGNVEEAINELLAEMGEDGCDFVSADGMDLHAHLVDAQNVAVDGTAWRWERGAWAPPTESPR